MQQQYGIVAMIQQGYYATYPLIAISVLCIAVILERMWALGGLRGRTTRTAAALVDPLRKGEFDQALKKTQARKRPFERIFYSLISAARTQDRDKLLQLDEEQRFEELLELKRYIWVLATSGASAPFIGLFGTVVGILTAFQSMAIMGTGGFSVVAAGISEALISTALGLAVAIIAVIFYNYFSVRIDNLNAVMHVSANHLINAALEGDTPMALSGPSSGSGGGVFWQINITPLTDIFLVLLIIFMITASISVESAAHVGLPLAENTSPEKRGVVVTYTADHEIFVNSKDIPSSELEPTLRDALAKIDPKIVIFQGDRKVLLGDMVKILSVAKAAGADQIAIAAKRATVEELERSLRQ